MKTAIAAAADDDDSLCYQEHMIRPQSLDMSTPRVHSM